VPLGTPATPVAGDVVALATSFTSTPEHVIVTRGYYAAPVETSGTIDVDQVPSTSATMLSSRLPPPLIISNGRQYDVQIEALSSSINTTLCYSSPPATAGASPPAYVDVTYLERGTNIYGSAVGAGGWITHTTRRSNVYLALDRVFSGRDSFAY
jgi:hypothetical protein